MIVQKDLGSSLLFFALFVVMLWVATGRAVYLLLGGGLFAAGATVAYQAVRPRAGAGVDSGSTRGRTRTGDGFQVVQGWFALAWGGIAGTGLGLGNPDRIPVVETDFIFAAIGEELGLLGATAIIVAFLLHDRRRACASPSRTEEPFEKLLATGLTTLSASRRSSSSAGVTRLLPLTGVTLPFVSYGGSSLLANYVLLALLVRICDDARHAGAARCRAGRRPRAVGPMT